MVDMWLADRVGEFAKLDHSVGPSRMVNNVADFENEG